jgi:hypothetical protein
LLFSVQQPVTLGYLEGNAPVAIASSATVHSALALSAPAASPNGVEPVVPPCVCAPSLPRPSPPQRAAQRSTSAGCATPASASIHLRSDLLRVSAARPERSAERREDVAVRLVEVLKRTLDTRLRDIKERLDGVESGHQHLEERLLRRPGPTASRARRRDRSLVGPKGPTRRPPSAAHLRPQGRPRRSHSVA